MDYSYLFCVAWRAQLACGAQLVCVLNSGCRQHGRHACACVRVNVIINVTVIDVIDIIFAHTGIRGFGSPSLLLCCLFRRRRGHGTRAICCSRPCKCHQQCLDEQLILARRTTSSCCLSWQMLQQQLVSRRQACIVDFPAPDLSVKACTVAPERMDNSAARDATRLQLVEVE